MILIFGYKQLEICAWPLPRIYPSTTLTIPPAAAPNGTMTYFIGIRGSLLLNSSIYVTYFSDRFSLANMTGTPSTEYLAENSDPNPVNVRRIVNCGSPEGEICAPAELDVLSAASGTQTSEVGLETATSMSSAEMSMTTEMVLTTVSGIATSMPVTQTIWVQAPPSPIASAFVPPSATSTAAAAVSKASDGKLPAMAYPVIITAICLTAACVIFWVWCKYHKKKHHHLSAAKDIDCESAASETASDPGHDILKVETHTERRHGRSSWRVWTDMLRFKTSELDSRKEARELGGGRTPTPTPAPPLVVRIPEPKDGVVELDANVKEVEERVLKFGVSPTTPERKGERERSLPPLPADEQVKKNVAVKKASRT